MVGELPWAVVITKAAAFNPKAEKKQTEQLKEQQNVAKRVHLTRQKGHAVAEKKPKRYIHYFEQYLWP